jgi:hypothetical protein
MDNKTKIAIGVVVLGSVAYYFYNKNKSTMSNVSSTIVNEPKKNGFDREKSSKELAVVFFALRNKKQEVKQPLNSFITDSKGNVIGIKGAEPMTEPMTELSIYKNILAGLNGISDDSDAEFIVNIFKKMIEAGDDRNYKPDLDTQIRIDSIEKKYPNALKKLDLG